MRIGREIRMEVIPVSLLKDKKGFSLVQLDEYAKRFDLMILNTQLSYYAHDMVKFEKYQKNIKEIVKILEK